MLKFDCRGGGQEQEDLSGRDQDGMVARTRLGTAKEARSSASRWFEGRTN